MFKSMTDATLDQYIRNQEQEIRWRQVDVQKAIAERAERRFKHRNAVENYTEMTKQLVKDEPYPYDLWK